MTNLKSDKVFLVELVNRFPEMKDDVLDDDFDGLLVLQLMPFKKFTQKAIDANDLSTVKKCFDFVNENIDLVPDNVQNSLYISYLAHLNFENNQQAYKLLSDTLKSVFKSLEEFTKSRSKNDNLNKFLDNLQ